MNNNPRFYVEIESQKFFDLLSEILDNGKQIYCYRKDNTRFAIHLYKGEHYLYTATRSKECLKLI